jgi:undecaprenyl-diphosphatase
MSFLRKKILVFVVVPIAVVFASIGMFLNYSNFHVVSKGVLYRSKQLTGNQLDHFIRKYGIKTVINLRGESAGDKWYQEEINIIKKDSISHLDIHISAVRYVPPQKVDSILKVALSARKPILVHCQGGADRTGLFCAAWKYKVEKYSSSIAIKNQLTWKYGHIPFFYNNTTAMDSSFYDYVKYIGNIP